MVKQPLMMIPAHRIAEFVDAALETPNLQGFFEANPDATLVCEIQDISAAWVATRIEISITRDGHSWRVVDTSSIGIFGVLMEEYAPYIRSFGDWAMNPIPPQTLIMRAMREYDDYIVQEVQSSGVNPANKSEASTALYFPITAPLELGQVIRHGGGIYQIVRVESRECHGQWHYHEVEPGNWQETGSTEYGEWEKEGQGQELYVPDMIEPYLTNAGIWCLDSSVQTKCAEYSVYTGDYRGGYGQGYGLYRLHTAIGWDIIDSAFGLDLTAPVYAPYPPYTECEGTIHWREYQVYWSLVTMETLYPDGHGVAGKSGLSLHFPLHLAGLGFALGRLGGILRHRPNITIRTAGNMRPAIRK